MPQVVLNQPRVGALVGQGKATRMAQHMRVGFDGQACEPAIIADHQPCGLPAEWAASLTEKERVALWLHLRPRDQPCLDHPYLVASEWVRGG